MDEDVRAAFLALSKSRLQDFFFYYEQSYGAGARSYAEKAVARWRTGTTRMSAQTTDRLLQVLPPLLGPDVKYDLLRKLRERYRQPEEHSLQVTTSNYRSAVIPLVERLIAKAYSSNLPAELEDRLGWLSHTDTTLAKELMIGAEAAAMRVMVSRLDDEFAQMEKLLSVVSKGSLNHRIELPYGVIRLTVKRGNTMDQKGSENAIGRTIDSTAITTSDQLLKHAIRNLTPEQIGEVSQKATLEALALHAESNRADQRFNNAARDIDSFVDNARKLNQLDADYKASATFDTASGTTSVKVEKNSSKIWIIVVIALAVLVVLLIAKK